MRSLATSVLLLLAGGCGSSSAPETGALMVVSGGSQKAEVGAELPDAVVVRLTDGNGDPAAGQVVTFAVVSGGGSVVAGARETDEQGEARERWTLGTEAGEQTIEVRAVDPAGGGPIVLGPITATALPGPVVKVVTRPGLYFMFVGEQVDVMPFIYAIDRYNNEVRNPPLTVSAALPFQVDGTSLSSPAETTATVILTSDTISISRNVSAVTNLEVLGGATGSWTCTGRGLYSSGPEGELFMTHESATFVVDSVRYTTDELLDGPYGPLTIFITVAKTITLEGGSTLTSSGEQSAQQAVQVPGLLYWARDQTFIDTAIRTSKSPLRYVGGSGCGEWLNITEFDPITITQ